VGFHRRWAAGILAVGAIRPNGVQRRVGGSRSVHWRPRCAQKFCRTRITRIRSLSRIWRRFPVGGRLGSDHQLAGLAGTCRGLRFARPSDNAIFGSHTTRSDAASKVTLAGIKFRRHLALCRGDRESNCSICREIKRLHSTQSAKCNPSERCMLPDNRRFEYRPARFPD